MNGRRWWVLTRNEATRARGAIVMRLAVAAMPVVLLVFLARMFDFIVAAEGHFDRPGSTLGVPGVGVLFTFMALTFFGWTAFDEHAWGTWDRQRSGPARPSEVLGSKLTITWIHLALQLIALFVVGVLWFDLTSLGSWWGVVIVGAVTVTVACAYGFMVFVLTPTSTLYLIPCHVGALAMAGLGGCLSPTSMMPGWIRAIAPATPTYWMMRGFRSTLLEGGGIAGVIRPSLLALTFGIAFAAIGWWRFDPEVHKRAFSE